MPKPNLKSPKQMTAKSAAVRSLQAELRSTLYMWSSCWNSRRQIDICHPLYPTIPKSINMRTYLVYPLYMCVDKMTKSFWKEITCAKLFNRRGCWRHVTQDERRRGEGSGSLMRSSYETRSVDFFFTSLDVRIAKAERGFSAKHLCQQCRVLQ